MRLVSNGSAGFEGGGIPVAKDRIDGDSGEDE